VKSLLTRCSVFKDQFLFRCHQCFSLTTFISYHVNLVNARTFFQKFLKEVISFY